MAGTRSAVDSLGPRLTRDIATAARVVVGRFRRCGWPDTELREHLIKKWAGDIDFAYEDPSAWSHAEVVFEACVSALDAALARRRPKPHP